MNLRDLPYAETRLGFWEVFVFMALLSAGVWFAINGLLLRQSRVKHLGDRTTRADNSGYARPLRGYKEELPSSVSSRRHTRTVERVDRVSSTSLFLEAELRPSGAPPAVSGRRAPR
jgi:hypothetical protein